MTKAESIVNDILLELSDRAGIGDELDGCDDEIKDEIRTTLIEIVKTHIGEE
jgi:hypothetical protein